MKDSELHLWITRLKSGDIEAFQAIYELTADHVFQTVFYLIKDKHDVEDVVSDVYMALLRSLTSFDMKKPFRPWLNGLIINHINNWRRKGWRRLRLFTRHNQLFVQPTSKGPDTLVLESEEKDTLLQQVSRLSSKLRVVIVLRYYQDCTFEEIADTLMIPLGTVKSRHHEALRRLRLNSGMIHLAKEAYIHVD